MTPLQTIDADFSASVTCFKDRVFLVTGATGSVGRVAALVLAKHGATVILHGRRQAKLDELYDEFEALGYPKPANIFLDLLKATEADYLDLAETIFATFKRLDGIFHAAGHMTPLAPLALQDLNSWQAHLMLNIAAPVAITRVCLPMLKRAVNARVIFLSESHVVNPTAYWGAFLVSKASLSNIAKIWNMEVANDSTLRFGVLLPGPIASQMRAMSHPGEHFSELPPLDSIAPAVLYMMLSDALSASVETLPAYFQLHPAAGIP